MPSSKQDKLCQCNICVNHTTSDPITNQTIRGVFLPSPKWSQHQRDYNLWLKNNPPHLAPSPQDELADAILEATVSMAEGTDPLLSVRAEDAERDPRATVQPPDPQLEASSIEQGKGMLCSEYIAQLIIAHRRNLTPSSVCLC
jgi:hypothetical protein